MRTSFTKGVRCIRLDKREVAVIREAGSLLAEIGRAGSVAQATAAAIAIEQALPLVDVKEEPKPAKPAK